MSLIFFLISLLALNVCIGIGFAWSTASNNTPANRERVCTYIVLYVITLIFAEAQAEFQPLFAAVFGPFYLILVLGHAAIRAPLTILPILAISVGAVVLFRRYLPKFRGARASIAAVALFFSVALGSSELIVSALIAQAKSQIVSTSDMFCFDKRPTWQMLAELDAPLRRTHAYILTSDNMRVHYSIRKRRFEPTADTIARHDIPRDLSRCPKSNLFGAGEP